MDYMPREMRSQQQATSGKALTRAQFTPDFVESRDPNVRFCAYHGTFHPIDVFSDPQKLSKWTKRYCRHFSNAGKRLSTVVAKMISDDEVRAYAKRLKVKISDMPEVTEQEVRGRPNRGSRRTVEARVDRMMKAAGIVSDEELRARFRAERLAREGAEAQQHVPAKKRKKTKEADRAAEDEEEPEEEELVTDLDAWLMERLQGMVAYDAAHTDDNTERGDEKSLWKQPEMSKLDFLTALDDGKPSSERQYLAEDAVDFLDNNVVPMVNVLNNDREKRRRLGAIKRVRNRLWKIAEGTAGFAELSRGFFRAQGGSKFLVDGTKKTCVKDAFVVTARWEGHKANQPRAEMVSQKKVNEDLAHLADEEMQIGEAVMYFREQCNLQIDCLSHGHDNPDNLMRKKGGPEVNLLQLKSGSYVAVLQAILEDGTVERHAVAYLSEFFFPPKPEFQGVLVDNDNRILPHLLDDEDRADKVKARKVFHSLFPLAKEVRIKSIWQVRAVL